jgi:hypothetical protein
MAVKITEKTVNNAIKAMVEAGDFAEDWKRNATNAKKIAKLILGEDADGKQVQPDKSQIALVYDYIKPDEAESAEDGDEGDASDADMGKVKSHYKTKYAKESPTKTGCGDDFDQAFRTYCGDAEGEDLLGKLKTVANANGIDAMAKWGHLKDRTGNTNIGMIRMNLANVLRGRVRKGDKVTIGKTKWDADPEVQKARKQKEKDKLDRLAKMKADKAAKAKAPAKKAAKKAAKKSAKKTAPASQAQEGAAEQTETAAE